jgi:hypothetical protein
MMARMEHHLAQVNVGRLRAPIDSPQLADFVAALDPVNALADASPGFVWRLQTEDGDATAIRVFDDEMIAINMSVWESLEALSDFVFGPAHVSIMRRRREFFERMEEAYLALWWVPAGHEPDTAEAKERLEALRRDGPTPFAFTVRHSFPPPDRPGGEPIVDDRWACPA